MEEHREPEEMTVSEAEKRVEKAVNYLEEQINRIDETPGKRNNARRRKLSSTVMTSLAEKYRILPPKQHITKKRNP